MSDHFTAKLSIIMTSTFPRDSALEGSIQISFIVPVYNVEAYLRECILSIFELRDISFEVIVIDDGSTDNSLDKINDLINGNPTVKTVTQQNKGQSVARNRGLQLATGNYIIFVDSDDKLSVSTVRDVLFEMQGDEEIIIGDFYRWDGGCTSRKQPSLADHSIRITGNQLLQRFFLKDFEMVIGRNIYKRSFLKKHELSFLEGVYYEDADWTLRCLTMAREILYIPKAFYYYRNQREGSTMNSPFSVRKYNDLFKVSQSIHQFSLDIDNKGTTNVINRVASNLLLTAVKRAELSGLSVNHKPLLDYYKQLKLPFCNNKIMQYILLVSKKLFLTTLMRRSL